MAEIVHKLKINGMTCGGCSKRVNTVLSEASWVIDVDVLMNQAMDLSPL